MMCAKLSIYPSLCSILPFLMFYFTLYVIFIWILQKWSVVLLPNQKNCVMYPNQKSFISLIEHISSLARAVHDSPAISEDMRLRTIGQLTELLVSVRNDYVSFNNIKL